MNAFSDLGPYRGHPADPRTEDDGPTEDEAREAAQAELETTPALIAEWLQAECFGAVEALPVYELADPELDRELTVPELLAVLFASPERETVRALHALRDKYVTANAEPIRERAAELLREHEQANARARDDAAADARYESREVA